MRSRLLLLSLSALLCFALLQGCGSKNVVEQVSKLALAEKNLDKVWKALQETATGDTLARFTSDQSDWLSQGRDAAIAALMAKETATPGSVPFSAYGETFDKATAAALVTQERAKALNILLAQEKDKDFKPTLAGKFGVEDRMGTKWYTFTPDQWGTAMTLGKVRGKLPMKAASTKLLKSALKTGDTMKFSGRLHIADCYDGLTGMAVEKLGEGMAWRELDNWDNFDNL